MKKLIKLIVGSVFILSIFGCTPSSHIVVGQTREPISPDKVKLYTKPPEKYEEIAIVDASSQSSWAVTDQGKIEKAIERLKEEAASLGANGILIGVSGTGNLATSSGGVATTTGGYGNTGYAYGVSSSAIHKTAKGMAIYVHE